MEVRPSSCYCCKVATSGMDIDAALNELGMLSTVTESRKQYLRERTRTLSEPGTSFSKSKPIQYSSQGKGANNYQVIQLNTQYVTSLSTGNLDLQSKGLTGADNASVPMEFGAKYSQSTLEREARSTRLSRMKLARIKRFRRPYDVPWRTTMEQCHTASHSTSCSASQTPSSSTTPSSTSLCSTPDRLRPADKPCATSNPSTPEKENRRFSDGTTAVQRSRSLDELDFAKLRLAEAENHNFIAQKREIEKMSQHLQKLQVD